MLTGYIGTYSSPESQGVYRFGFDEATGALVGPELFYAADNAKWVSLHDDRLAIPVAEPGGAGTALLRLAEHAENAEPAEAIAQSSEFLSEHDTPCNIAQRDDYIFTANYHDGTVMSYRLGPEGLTIDERIECGEEAGCHQILLHGAYLMVPCLQQHKIRIFDTDDAYAEVGAIEFPLGSGPRHGVFNADHTKLYVVSEWSNQLFVFDVQQRGVQAGEVPPGTFTLVQTLDLLPEGAGDYATRNGPDESAATAAIRLSSDERFLYISIRFRDQLLVVDVSGPSARIVQRTSCGGEHPRDFILSPDERYLIVANRTAGGIVSMTRDAETGLIGAEVGRIPQAEGVSLAIQGG